MQAKKRYILIISFQKAFEFSDRTPTSSQTTAIIHPCQTSNKYDCFHKTNLEIVSTYFKTEVRIYFVTLKCNVLQCKTFNKNYNKTLRLFRSREAHFDCLFTEEHYANLGFCQNIVFSLVRNLDGDDERDWTYKYTSINKERFFDIEYEVLFL